MIRVIKPSAPARLAHGIPRTEDNCANYTADSAAYRSGAAKFEFSKTIYGHRTVKTVLRDAQHSKCCFCEGRFEAHAAADVEHYRPKSYVQQSKGSVKLYPGYYWLVYDWENLYYCCQVCNRSYKGNLFPLLHPGHRARTHTDNINDEKPLLLDPGGPEDPRHHLGFREEIAIARTSAGRMTIEVVGINRPALVEERLALLNELKRLSQVIRLLDGNAPPEAVDLLDAARRKLDEAVLPTARFSAMATDWRDGTGPA
jgi:uncharacterized protein (TIGR02646 family)